METHSTMKCLKVSVESKKLSTCWKLKNKVCTWVSQEKLNLLVNSWLLAFRATVGRLASEVEVYLIFHSPREKSVKFPSVLKNFSLYSLFYVMLLRELILTILKIIREITFSFRWQSRNFSPAASTENDQLSYAVMTGGKNIKQTINIKFWRKLFR